MKRSRFPFIVTGLVLVFFYLPILILVVDSFNSSRFGGAWRGFSLKWYARLFHEPAIWEAARNTLFIALLVTFVSLVLGTASALALHRFFKSRLQRFHYTLVYTPLVVPEILMGISLLMAFVAAGVRLGMLTIILAHVTFCVSYVALIVLGRLQDFDFSIVEAARDLGASSWTTAWRVVLPMLAPGTGRRGPDRLHLVGGRFRHHLLRRRPRGDHAPHSRLQHDQARRHAADQCPVDPAAGLDLHDGAGQPAPVRVRCPKIQNHGVKPMKSHARSLALAATLVVVVLLAGQCGGGKKAAPVLHLYTWSDYIKPELVSRFEAENRCRVVIDTFDSNEAMYAKLKAGATGYDVITPTSYMVSLMNSQGMLLPLDPDLAAEWPACRPGLPGHRHRQEDGLFRPLHADELGHRLFEKQGREFRADLGHVRPGRSEGAHGHAQRHARDDRRRP